MATQITPERIGKYLTVERVDTGRAKTKVWIVNGSDDAPLGQIRWYTHWRQYTFWPTGLAVLNATCLDDIANFTRRQTHAHMAALAVSSPATDAKEES